jgi:spermidine/putrescine transport system substrate-binding protein
MSRLVRVLLALAMLGAFACPALAADEEPELNIFTWELYIDYDTMIAPFEEETGIRVNYTNFTSNEEMLAKLESVKGGEYDIVLASDYAIDILRNDGLLYKLDKALIPNFGNIDEAFQGQNFDPENEYTVPYAAGTPLIVYDERYVDIEITGYESLWDPALADSVVAMDDGRNIIGITLRTLGQSMNVKDPTILEQAREKLLKLKPNIRALNYDTPHNLMISGEATVGYMFTPQVVWAMDENPNLKLVYPKEGLGFGIDSLVIPVNAPHPANAHAFLDFALRPEIGAAIAEAQQYQNCNKAADPLLSEEYKSNPALYFPSELLEGAEYIEDVGDVTPIYDEIWTAFKQE